MILDTVLIIISGVCLTAGIIGCVLPVLPGPVLSYAGILILQLSSIHPFTATFLIIYAILVALAAVLDYVIPVYGTKKFEGSKYGMWGSAVGLVLGMIFFFPFGIILGPMLGAFTGELINGKTKDKALKSALGSFFGFLAGTAMKLILSLSMVYYFVLNIYNFYAGL